MPYGLHIKALERLCNQLPTPPAISMHLYGPRLGLLDGRDYDPSRDFVCDRLERKKLAERSSSLLLLPAVNLC